MFISLAQKIKFATLIIALSFTAFAQSDRAQLANEYYQQGDFEKAESIYSDIDNNRAAVPLIFANYVELLQNQNANTKAEKFVIFAIKNYPSEIDYRITLLHLYETRGELDKRDRYLKNIEKDYGNNPMQLNLLARGLLNQQMYNESLLFFLKARKLSGNEWSFALDIANVYRMQGDKAKMTDEYLLYAESNPRNLSYVKNIFQQILLDPKEQDILEESLISKIQKFPDETLYSELLIWLELQRKNFYGAFIQARAYDKRMNTGGQETMSVGHIAMDNESWSDAIDIYTYIIEKYPDTRNQITAKTKLITAKENKIKSDFPVDRIAIRNLASEYQSLVREMGENASTLDLLRSKARLHAFYLNELDSAITILNRVISNRRTPRALASYCKLDLGDIYLLDNQPWESTLLYSQVEKSDKESPIGYEAKLRNAKLNYYTGNFALAKEHLDILKLATTREISNDAISLSLLIQNNTVFDSTDIIMQQFANIELMIYRNLKDRAVAELNQMLTDNPNHSLTDEIYWQLSDLALERADYEESIKYLNLIIEKYPKDILGDDAFYKKSVILSDYIGDKEKALESMIEFLKRYPGSMYGAEARVRVRKLRGDYIN